MAHEQSKHKRFVDSHDFLDELEERKVVETPTNLTREASTYAKQDIWPTSVATTYSAVQSQESNYPAGAPYSSTIQKEKVSLSGISISHTSSVPTSISQNSQSTGSSEIPESYDIGVSTSSCSEYQHTSSIPVPVSASQSPMTGTESRESTKVGQVTELRRSTIFETSTHTIISRTDTVTDCPDSSSATTSLPSTESTPSSIISTTILASSSTSSIPSHTTSKSSSVSRSSKHTKTTDTVFETSTSTIYTCAETVEGCPGHSTTTTTSSSTASNFQSSSVTSGISLSSTKSKLVTSSSPTSKKSDGSSKQSSTGSKVISNSDRTSSTPTISIESISPKISATQSVSSSSTQSTSQNPPSFQSKEPLIFLTPSSIRIQVVHGSDQPSNTPDTEASSSLFRTAEIPSHTFPFPDSIAPTMTSAIGLNSHLRSLSDQTSFPTTALKTSQITEIPPTLPSSQVEGTTETPPTSQISVPTEIPPSVPPTFSSISLSETIATTPSPSSTPLEPTTAPTSVGSTTAIDSTPPPSITVLSSTFVSITSVPTTDSSSSTTSPSATTIAPAGPSIIIVPKHKEPTAGTWIGVAIGLAAFIFFIIVGLLWYRRRRPKQREKQRLARTGVGAAAIVGAIGGVEEKEREPRPRNTLLDAWKRGVVPGASSRDSRASRCGPGSLENLMPGAGQHDIVSPISDVVLHVGPAATGFEDHDGLVSPKSPRSPTGSFGEDQTRRHFGLAL